MDESTGSTDRPFQLTLFVFGIVFVAIGVAGLDAGIDADTSWIWVALLTGAGIAGLAKAVGSLRS